MIKINLFNNKFSKYLIKNNNKYTYGIEFCFCSSNNNYIKNRIFLYFNNYYLKYQNKKYINIEKNNLLNYENDNKKNNENENENILDIFNINDLKTTQIKKLKLHNKNNIYELNKIHLGRKSKIKLNYLINKEIKNVKKDNNFIIFSKSNYTKNLKTNENNNFTPLELKSIEILENEIKKNENENEKVKEITKEFETNFINIENKEKIIKKIYKASINHVRDENLWKKYVQNTFIISSYLDSSDIVILIWCFGKIGYRDNRLINLLCSIILKKINELSPCAIALLLNSLKKLEIKKYDTIELLTNQFCFHISNSTPQDIALIANCLSFFYIYHKNFWRKCILKLKYHYHFTYPLHLCLIMSAFARLDLKEGSILLSLSRSAKKLGKYFSPNNLALVIHSFAKLKFNHPKFYSHLFQYVHIYLDKQIEEMNVNIKNKIESVQYENKLKHKINKENEINDNETNENNQINIKKKKKFDLQSLVLLLYSSCLITCINEILLKKISYLILPLQNLLTDHKIDKLKYVSDYIKYIYPHIYQKLPNEIIKFYNYISTYEFKKNKKNYSRWINEVSNILCKINVNHSRNIYINNICANIILSNFNIIIKCLGPYSYYVNSLETTSICDLELEILKKKNYKVVTLNYNEWNNLIDYEDKVHFLYNFGRNAANYFYSTLNKENSNENININVKEKENIEINNLEKKETIENLSNNINEHSKEIIEKDINDFSDDSDEEMEIMKYIDKNDENVEENIINIKNYLNSIKK